MTISRREARKKVQRLFIEESEMRARDLPSWALENEDLANVYHEEAMRVCRRMRAIYLPDTLATTPED